MKILSADFQWKGVLFTWEAFSDSDPEQHFIDIAVELKLRSALMSPVLLGFYPAELMDPYSVAFPCIDHDSEFASSWDQSLKLTRVGLSYGR